MTSKQTSSRVFGFIFAAIFIVVLVLNVMSG
jgi:hypothetical protein